MVGGRKNADAYMAIWRAIKRVSAEPFYSGEFREWTQLEKSHENLISKSLAVLCKNGILKNLSKSTRLANELNIDFQSPQNKQN